MALFGNPISAALSGAKGMLPQPVPPALPPHGGSIPLPPGFEGQPHGFGPGGPVIGPPPVAYGHPLEPLNQPSPMSAIAGAVPNPLAAVRNAASEISNPSNPMPAIENAAGDEGHASGVIAHLMAALQSARDPNLRESLSNALAAIHKHLAGYQKERQEALAGKLSPRLLAEAHGIRGANPGGPMIPLGDIHPHLVPGGRLGAQQAPEAHALAALGNYQGAVQAWAAHHPYAMAHNNIPEYVRQWEAAYSHAPSPAATAQ